MPADDPPILAQQHAMPWSFSMRCPQGHHVTQDEFSRDALRECLVADQPIQFYCIHCEEFWEADEKQRRIIGWALDNTS
jgi:hypothetical protein